MTRSIASSRVASSMTVRLLRAVSSAASLSTLARSAPENPGVRRGAVSRSGSGGGGGQVDVGGQRLALGVHPQDRLATLQVGSVDRDLPVESTGAQQRRV